MAPMKPITPDEASECRRRSLNAFKTIIYDEVICSINDKILRSPENPVRVYQWDLDSQIDSLASSGRVILYTMDHLKVAPTLSSLEEEYRKAGWRARVTSDPEGQEYLLIRK